MMVLQWGHGDEAVEEAELASHAPGRKRLQWGHGDEAVEEQRPSSSPAESPCFNGATAMKPWKRQPVFLTAGDFSLLQWGHGDEAVEEVEAVFARDRRSMLQWGHGDEAVEESRGIEAQSHHPPASMGPRR